MKIPEQYAWLTKIDQLPRTIHEGLKSLGIKETIGTANNPVIMGWIDELAKAGKKINGYSADSVPWCGLFAAIIAYRRADNIDEVVEDPLWARNWSKYGSLVDEAMLGDMLVFGRQGGGHVGFYIAEDHASYHVLGGNQGDAVSIVRIAKNRLLHVRRPKYKVQPTSVRKYMVMASGAISENEA
jgi:uncharacterized protein (TIGR02594 family)